MVLLASALSPSAAADAATDPVPDLPTEPFAGHYFVTQQYRDLLGREPDAAGVAFWVTQLEGGMSPGGMISQFVDSPEFGEVRAPVARLYRAALGRLPDESGWAFWASRLAAGESLESLAAAFIATPEGTDRLGAEDPGELVEALYEQVLGRSPDTAGRAFWVGQLAGGRSRASVVVAFAESPEFVAAFAPEIRAALLYSGLLGRTPDAGGLEFWTAQLAGGRSYVSTIDGFVASEEYLERLRGLWCGTISLDEAFDWDDTVLPVDAPPSEGRLAVLGVAEELGEAFDEGRPDELSTVVLDDKPAPPVLVLGVHEPVLGGACLPLLAIFSRPDLVRFAPTPMTTSQLQAASERVMELAGPGGWWGIGRGRGRLSINLTGPGLAAAEDIIDEFGAAIEELTVGSFPYPMPDPLPAPVCRAEPVATVDPSSLDLGVAVTLPATVAPGVVASGTFTVTNNGAATVSIWWGAEVTAFLGDGGTSTSTFNGVRNEPLNIRVLGPGESATGPLDIGTDACDPLDGYRLAPGDYEVWGTIPVVLGAAPDLSPGDEDTYVRLPPVTLTLAE